MVVTEVEGFAASCITVGVVFQQVGWHIAPRSDADGGRKPLQAAFTLASQVLHLERVSNVRACNGCWLDACTQCVCWRERAHVAARL